ncbi:uncharacterized protein LOC135474017 [Liolophura sinensis]|uniref:uncharacterized protein LOC135474017 n=1 Tax=Liolophura sinensis TaxID=3198878 RepID=UPI00315936D7
MWTPLIPTVLVITLFELGSCQFSGHNTLKVCTASTPGSEWVRRGNHLRKRGECQQGYLCDGELIQKLRAPCREPSYFSVHTGTCSFPDVYAYVFGSFNCQDEENDENLDFEKLIAKRDEMCRPLIERATPDMTELYVGDSNDCRLMYKCPLVAEHDDWLHRCPIGTRFQEGDQGPCVEDVEGCYLRGK